MPRLHSNLARDHVNDTKDRTISLLQQKLQRKHRRHRLINERFPALAAQALAPGGAVYLRTDDQPYFEQMTAVFAASPAFRPADTPPELAGLLTDFERDFAARGIPTRRAAYLLV